MNHNNQKKQKKEKSLAYRQAGYAVACYDLKISVPAVSILENKSSDYQKIFTENGKRIELDGTMEKSRSTMEKIVVAIFCGLESERRYSNSTKLSLDKSVIKKIGQYIAPYTQTGRELTAYQHLLNIRAQDFIRDPLVWQKIKDLAGEIFKSNELSAQQVRALIRQSFTRSFEKWKKRQHNKNK